MEVRSPGPRRPPRRGRARRHQGQRSSPGDRPEVQDHVVPPDAGEVSANRRQRVAPIGGAGRRVPRPSAGCQALGATAAPFAAVLGAESRHGCEDAAVAPERTWDGRALPDQDGTSSLRDCAPAFGLLSPWAILCRMAMWRADGLVDMLIAACRAVVHRIFCASAHDLSSIVKGPMYGRFPGKSQDAEHVQ